MPDEGMKHLAHASRPEHQKTGKLLAESDFECYRGLLKAGGE